MQNEHGGLWDPDWIVKQTGAYPVDNYVYMVIAPHCRPKFFQDEWDAFHHPLYLHKTYAKIVKIKVQPVSEEQQEFRRLDMHSHLAKNTHPTMITFDEYYHRPFSNIKGWLLGNIKGWLHKWVFWWSIGLAINVIAWLGKRLLPAWLSLTLFLIAIVFYGISVWSNYWKK